MPRKTKKSRRLGQASFIRNGKRCVVFRSPKKKTVCFKIQKKRATQGGSLRGIGSCKRVKNPKTGCSVEVCKTRKGMRFQAGTTKCGRYSR